MNLTRGSEYSEMKFNFLKTYGAYISITSNTFVGDGQHCEKLDSWGKGEMLQANIALFM